MRAEVSQVGLDLFLKEEIFAISLLLFLEVRVVGDDEAEGLAFLDYDGSGFRIVVEKVAGNILEDAEEPGEFSLVRNADQFGSGNALGLFYRVGDLGRRVVAPRPHVHLRLEGFHPLKDEVDPGLLVRYGKQDVLDVGVVELYMRDVSVHRGRDSDNRLVDMKSVARHLDLDDRGTVAQKGFCLPREFLLLRDLVGNHHFV